MQELAPEPLESAFGIKLAGDAGALVAKSTAEGHFIVRMTWNPAVQHTGHETPVDVH